MKDVAGLPSVTPSPTTHTDAPPEPEPLSDAERWQLADLLRRWGLELRDPADLAALAHLRERLGRHLTQQLLAGKRQPTVPAPPGRIGHLTVSRRPGQSVQVGDQVWVTVLRVRGDVVRLRFEAPVEIPLRRAQRGQRLEMNAPAVEEPGDA